MSIIYAVSLAKINCLPQKITHTHTILGEVWNLPHKFHLYLINILALSLWFDQISVSLFATLIKLHTVWLTEAKNLIRKWNFDMTLLLPSMYIQTRETSLQGKGMVPIKI